MDSLRLDGEGLAEVARITKHLEEQVSYDSVAHAGRLTDDLVQPSVDSGNLDLDLPKSNIETASQLIS